MCPLDNPLVSLGQPGCWRYSRKFAPLRPSCYINLFNNQWTTNFRLWNTGTWTARVRIWAFDRFDAASCLTTPSLEARYPLHAALAEGAGGTLSARQAGPEISARGTLLTAFGPNPDGAGRVLRLWELAGVDGPCEVRLPTSWNVSSVQPVNLRGEAAGPPIAVHDGRLVLTLNHFAPVTVILPDD